MRLKLTLLLCANVAVALWTFGTTSKGSFSSIDQFAAAEETIKGLKSYTEEQTRAFENLYSQVQGARKESDYYRLATRKAESAFLRLFFLNIACLAVFVIVGNKTVMKGKAETSVDMNTSESISEQAPAERRP